MLPDSLPRLSCATILCFLSSWGALLLARIPAEADILWPANGIVLAFLLGVQRRFWASYLAGGVLASIAVHILLGFSGVFAWIFTAANVLETLLAALWLTRKGAVPLDLNRLEGLMRFLTFGVVLAPLTSTAFVQIVLTFLGRPSELLGLTNWFLGDAMGMAVMTPLMLAIVSSDLRTLMHRQRWLETVVILGGITLLTVGVFEQHGLPLVCVLLAALVLAIFRLGMAGSAIAVFLMIAPAAYLTVHWSGPFVPEKAVTRGESIYSIFSLQCFLAVDLVTIYSVSAALTEREKLHQELAEAYHEAKTHAAIDHTTGLANRRTFDRDLAREWRRALREKAQLALLMIDIDQFKQYNDQYGHLAGDAGLRKVASILAKGPLRASDLVARYGGEEFVVLLPRAGARGAEMIAEALRTAVLDAMIPHSGNLTGLVTISVGVAAILPQEGMMDVLLVELADAALYRAKREGRNRVCVSNAVPEEGDAGTQ